VKGENNQRKRSRRGGNKISARSGHLRCVFLETKRTNNENKQAMPCSPSIFFARKCFSQKMGVKGGGTF